MNATKGKKEKMFPKPAIEHPAYKWVMLWQSWTMLLHWNTRSDYTNPDYFDMYIYNDFHWYGLAELIENMVSSPTFPLAHLRPPLPTWRERFVDDYLAMLCCRSKPYSSLRNSTIHTASTLKPK